MPLLLSCQELEKSYGSTSLFKDLSFGISDQDRIGLIGPNGSGKSTLLQILDGVTTPDNGTVSVRKMVRVGYVAQDESCPADRTIQQIMEETPLNESLTAMEFAARISTTLGRAGFQNAEAEAGSLSGGWKKRLAIARELLKKPDLLLLDEPTNHLDVEAIFWLEKLLNTAQFAWLAVSHDRYFLENTAESMMEIDRAYPGGLFTVKASYSEFLIKKDEFLAAQSKYQEALGNKVRREVEWLRRGAKARTTKSKARIDTAGQMIEELNEMSARTVKRTTQIDFAGTDRQTKRLVDVAAISKSLGGRELFRDFSFVLSPGARIGLLGANGSGKTTLLKLLNGEVLPDSGNVRRADGVKIVYFDQGREHLDGEMTLRKALASHGDSVIFRDRSVHVTAWANRFLFRAEQLDLPLSRLSGGEQARVLIARMMLEPADVLLLDEPTNDLDIRTLEVLEESLMDFPGALVLVTHDRYMLERVSTVILGLNAQGGGAAIFADCSQWEREQELRRGEQENKKRSAVPRQQQPTAAKKKLSYIESREWEQIEQKIAEAEQRLQVTQQELHHPETVTDSTRLLECYKKVNEAQKIVDDLFVRWEVLSSKLES
ncbi:MAG: transporter related [Candidatus Angelobacter sp.]|nr:transporter related [Candidatus Angelobacter sp.]